MIEYIVEDGTGKVDSTSYVDISYIDQYAENMGYSDWSGYSLPVKQSYSNQATQYIDLSFNFSGIKTDSSQSLEFPRTDCYESCIKEYFENKEIPVKLKKAVCEIAINRGLNDSRLITSTGEVFKKEKVGSLEVERFTPGTTQKTYPQVNKMLSCFSEYNFFGVTDLERA